MNKTKLAVLLVMAGSVCLALTIWFQRPPSYEIVQNPKCTYSAGSNRILAIPGQKLDIESCLSLTLGSLEDVKFASNLSDDAIQEAENFIKAKTKFQSTIRAARKIGDFILIEVDEQDVADGGFEFVYSIQDNKVVGFFMAGIKG